MVRKAITARMYRMAVGYQNRVLRWGNFKLTHYQLTKARCPAVSLNASLTHLPDMSDYPTYQASGIESVNTSAFVGTGPTLI